MSKGSRPRPTNRAKYAKGWLRAFGPAKPTGKAKVTKKEKADE